jgi:hypothetical protein
MPVMFKKPVPQEAIRAAHPNGHFYSPGSDVNYLSIEVLPHLWPGVRIHIHDTFLPLDLAVTASG